MTNIKSIYDMSYKQNNTHFCDLQRNMLIKDAVINTHITLHGNNLFSKHTSANKQ